MSNLEAQLEQMQKEVRYLRDRQDILDCVARHARGQDRHDIEVLTSAYHSDGFDEHGNVVNRSADYARWVNALHDQSFELHLHNITTHNCEIEGDEAHCESYVLFGLKALGEMKVWLGGGRYLDRMERRNGIWKIALRRTIIDWMFTADASVLKSEYFLSQEYPYGRNSKEDISYQRPLRLPDEPRR
jgi:hypothetical protein